MRISLFDSDSGNLNFDFLIGLMVFIVAFLYVVNAIPGIFLPYETNMVDLGSVIYRTSAVLAEDPGWYTNADTGYQYSDWENFDLSYLDRAGLAVDKADPNVLSLKKIEAMKQLPYNTSRDDLGLNGTLIYDYSLDILKIGPSGPVDPPILSISGNTDTNNNVESLDREVLIREGEGFYIPPQTAKQQNSLKINNSPRLEGNITVRIGGVPNKWNQFTNNIRLFYYMDNDTKKPEWEISNYYNNHYYYIYKNDVYVANPTAEGCTTNDVIDVVINASAINEGLLTGSNLTNIDLWAMGCIPEDITSHIHQYSRDNPDGLYHYFNTPAIMKLEVWQE